MIPGPWTALILVLAVYRLFRLAAWDTFPPVVRARGRLVGAYEIRTGSTNTLLNLNGEEADVDVRFRRPTLEHFIHCPYCLGFWLSVATYIIWVFFPHDSLYFFAPWALSGAVALFAEHFDPE